MEVASLARSWLKSIHRAWRVRALERDVAANRLGGDQLPLASRIRHLGDAYLESSRIHDAETCLVEALALYRSNPKTGLLDLANSLRSVAILREAQGDAEQASRLWEEAHRLYSSVNVLTGVAEAAAHLALLVRSLGDFRMSQDWMEKAEAASTESGDRETQEFTQLTRTKIEKDQSRS